MKKSFLLVLLGATMCCTAMADKKPSKKPAATTTKSQSAFTSGQEGLFGVLRRDADYFFDIPDSLLSRRFLATVRFTSTPAGTGKYGGESVNQQTVYWEPAPGNVMLLRSDLMVNMGNSMDAIDRAVKTSNNNPIIGTFKIEGHRNGHYLVKVTSFFNEDNPALGVSRDIKKEFGLQGYMPQASYIESIKTFPLNTEIRTVKTWMTSTTSTIAGSNTGRVTLGLNISFVLLPKDPMIPRLFDPRVGYFSDRYYVFADNQQRSETMRFITRWRLEPKDSTDMEKMKRGELVEPKKPIVYYIDPATPKKWRPYLIQGVNDWQKAFEHAGFKNAIMAKEWPVGCDSMSMEDARFSVIRYYASPIENAYGPQIHDPRTGEIIESHIGWYHNVMRLCHDWYMIQAGCVDPEARKMKLSDELMGQLIRFVSSHEIGHTLGLRHNFGSSSTVPVDSLRNRAWLEANGHTPSIMDYARFNYVAQPEDSITHAGMFPRIGDYDCWAIKWGYTPMWNAYDAESDHWELEKMTSETLRGNRRLWFGDGETNTTNDSRCQREDLGDDAVKASEYGILNLKRIIKQLPEWTYESNDIYGKNLSSMYDQVLSQFNRYANHVAGNIAGVYKDYKTVDEPGAVFTNLSREKQKYALDYINRHIFTEPTWLINVPYMNRLMANPQVLTIGVGRNVMGHLLKSSRLEKMTPEYPLNDYLKDLTNMLFKETASGAKTTEYRRALQTTYVTTLVGYYKGGDVTSPTHANMLSALRTLSSRLKVARAADQATRDHYAALTDIIKRALTVK